MEENSMYDVAVVGGGAAGLSGSIALARSLRSVLVIDGGQPRNAPADGAHNVLGREGIAPTELLAAGRREAEAYGVRIMSGQVSTAGRDGDLFRLETRSGVTVRCRKLLLATGLVDELPELDGLDRLWGHSVLHCPYCHGWEVRGQRIGVLGTAPASAHQALLFRQLSDQVSYFRHTGPDPSAEAIEEFEAIGIKIINGRLSRLRTTDRTLTGAVLADGREVGIDALVVAPRFVARGDLYQQLGGDLAPHPSGGLVINSDAAARTDVPGVYVAGNATDLSAMVSMSSASGVLAGAVINADLVSEAVQAAVQTRKAISPKDDDQESTGRVSPAAPRV